MTTHNPFGNRRQNDAGKHQTSGDPSSGSKPSETGAELPPLPGKDAQPQNDDPLPAPRAAARDWDRRQQRSGARDVAKDLVRNSFDARRDAHGPAQSASSMGGHNRKPSSDSRPSSSLGSDASTKPQRIASDAEPSSRAKTTFAESFRQRRDEGLQPREPATFAGRTAKAAVKSFGDIDPHRFDGAPSAHQMTSQIMNGVIGTAIQSPIGAAKDTFDRSNRTSQADARRREIDEKANRPRAQPPRPTSQSQLQANIDQIMTGTPSHGAPQQQTERE
jgi:hypothetical protein